MGHDVSADTDALRHRIQRNVEGASHNLEDWILQQVQPSPGMRVLDLGCGTGKQIFVLERLVSPGGSVLGVDLSEQAVEEVNARAHREGHAHVRALQASLDDCGDVLREERFDLVLSTYAIYYATDVKQLLCNLRDLVTAHGQVFVCGPGRGTNQELIDLVNRLVMASSIKAEPIDDFLGPGEIDDVARCYSQHQTVRLPNTVRFRTAEAVLEWWQNHNSFIPQAYDAVARALHEHVSRHGDFVLTKNVLGVHLRA